MCRSGPALLSFSAISRCPSDCRTNTGRLTVSLAREDGGKRNSSNTCGDGDVVDAVARHSKDLLVYASLEENVSWKTDPAKRLATYIAGVVPHKQADGASRSGETGLLHKHTAAAFCEHHLMGGLGRCGDLSTTYVRGFGTWSAAARTLPRDPPPTGSQHSYGQGIFENRIESKKTKHLTWH